MPEEILQDWGHLALWNGLRPPTDENKEAECDGRSLSRRHLLKEVLSHWNENFRTPNRQYAALIDWLNETDWLTEVRSVNVNDVPALPADKWLSVSANNKFLPRLESFYRVEEGGTWTNAFGARLIFRLDNAERRVREVRLRVWSRSTEKLGERQLTVAEAGSGVEMHIGLPAEWGMMEACLSLKATSQPDFYSIAFVVDKAFNPASLGVGLDARDLGVYLSEMCIITDASAAKLAEVAQPSCTSLSLN
ncbi:MAG: hypothetical protein AB7U61_07480 [Methylocystis sp.]